MSYTTPTITASGGTWASLKKGGLPAQIEAVITANSFGSDVKAQLRAFKRAQGDLKLRDLIAVVANYLRGQPILTADVNAQLLAYAGSLKALLAAVEEVNVLIDANAGTIATTPNSAGTGLKKVRTLP